MAVKIADLKNNLSRHLARVRRGSEITVYDRNTPVARILPYRPDERATDGTRRDDEVPARVAMLVQQGVLSAGHPGALAEWVEAHPPVPRSSRTPGAVETLIKTRRESRR
jgi:prevent-host-death family protein